MFAAGAASLFTDAIGCVYCCSDQPYCACVEGLFLPPLYSLPIGFSRGPEFLFLHIVFFVNPFSFAFPHFYLSRGWSIFQWTDSLCFVVSQSFDCFSMAFLEVYGTRSQCQISDSWSCFCHSMGSLGSRSLCRIK